MALGMLDMSVEEFLEMRPSDFWLKLEYYQKARMEEYRFKAAVVRKATVTIVNMFAKNPVKDLEKFWPIEVENVEAPQIDEANMEESINRLKDLLNGK